MEFFSDKFGRIRAKIFRTSKNLPVLHHTVAASNKRYHPTKSIYYRHIHMDVIHRAHPVRGELHIQHQPKGCNNIPSFLQRTAPIASWSQHHFVAIGNP